MSRRHLFAFLAACSLNLSYASVTIPIVLFGDHGETKNIGTITAEDSLCGVLLTPNLHDLSPGVHGFHVHEKPSCEDKGMAAGGHLDPQKTNQHEGPYQHGHLGDMPVLIVNQDGTATLPTLAPRFKLSQILGHTLMIHAGGDNYSDTPEKLGGGGTRIACGVIKK
jgi:Cu-Zn family superoxide dismutase